MMKQNAARLVSDIHINPCVINAQYAVRGLVPMKADEIRQQLQTQAGRAKYTFENLVECNIGNPQALEQRPLTFFRQVMSLIDAPFLLENEAILSTYPEDVVSRSREYLKRIGNRTGAYTESAGYAFVREIVAKYINERDNGIKPLAEASSVVLTDGASTGVRLILQTLIGDAKDAVMLPIPQYPLYTAQISLLGGTPAMYYLREKEGWALDVDDLGKVYDECCSKHGATPRVLVVINPGNPTGSVLDRQVMEKVVKFCCDRRIVLLADEVYQENIYASNKRFLSFRSVVLGLPEPYNTNTILVSLHSTSKGIIGECGRRGGFFSMTNVPRIMNEQVLKMCSINLCSNVNGQIMTALMCSPPSPGDASYKLYNEEYNGIFKSLKYRAELLAKELNSIRGFSCQPVEGAMYAFPRIELPSKYAARHEELNTKEGRQLSLDARWALELLESTGIVVVPGSGFGQEPGTLHFRTTILPPADQMERVVKALRSFQEGIWSQYA
ncbi:putative alanine aminotransferase [Trypanosoma vivax]|uniref:Putative alanine aminotransferase n=1 Tax=Trypanosoma vivax (strain Y486) TaxID=1055687 RepID=G0TRG0_TRYVY|nr:putative alanine aminotransferase [Trypanosoma vivax]CCC46524.1 putative alanine aminotransferase [Trypanosoma vivax Y486]